MVGGLGFSSSKGAASLLCSGGAQTDFRTGPLAVVSSTFPPKSSLSCRIGLHCPQKCGSALLGGAEARCPKSVNSHLLQVLSPLQQTMKRLALKRRGHGKGHGIENSVVFRDQGMETNKETTMIPNQMEHEIEHETATGT